MNKISTVEKFLELESQLSCPSGENGIEVAENMNELNIGMTLNTIDFLNIQTSNSVLELGHGNCKHLGRLLESTKEIDYTGLEISESMWREAKKNNITKNATFALYDGNIIPFKNKLFDRVMSVNTIYFWSNPELLINEIERILKPNGICILTYADIQFMKSLPFVREKFTLFGRDEITKLVGFSTMEIIEFKDHSDQIKSKTGAEVTRSYTMVKIKKN